MKIIFPRLRNRITIVFIFLFIIPAFWFNLGKLAFNDDEAIRALVALEMDLSGNYIVPTLNGINYHAKPPLYNWILSIYSDVFGGYTEFNTRSLTVCFLLLFGLIIYFFSKQYFTQRNALIISFIFITCGRILFWDSMLGYIDIAYSMVSFLSFMLIYKFHSNKKYLWLFISSYGLMAIGYLMKGFPSFLFQGITLAVLFYFFDKWKNALSWKHLIGILTSIVIIGSYYLAYNHFSPFQSVFDTLIDQSSRRTIFIKGIPETLKFILEFPFEYIYHFLPWSLLVFLLFKKDIMSRLVTNPYIKYCWYIFLFNIPVYWISPGTLPRYILMLMPLLFTVLMSAYLIHKKEKTRILKIIEYTFFAALIGVIAFTFYPMFDSRFNPYKYRFILCSSLGIGVSYLAYRYFINDKNRMLTLILCLLIFRCGLNIFYLPEKAKESRLNICKQSALDIAEKYSDQNLFVDYKSKIGNLASFYITNSNKKILPRIREVSDPQGIHIYRRSRLDHLSNYQILDSIFVCEDPSTLFLVSFNE